MRNGAESDSKRGRKGDRGGGRVEMNGSQGAFFREPWATESKKRAPKMKKRGRESRLERCRRSHDEPAISRFSSYSRGASQKGRAPGGDKSLRIV